ncbi:MAG: GNAT family N-acetyltransferase [Fluviicola sp.]|nr:MAG: GNAT family N-acetyltransferase [Fluviicola sp.]
MKKIIETERLIMRPFTLDDAQASYEMNTCPEVMEYLGGPFSGSVEDISDMLQENTLGDYEKYNFGRFAVIHKETNEFMGFTGLKYVIELDEVDIGYRLKHKFWRQGYGYESTLPCVKFAFDDLGLDRIISLANPDNIASTNLMKKLGLTYEKEVHIYGDNAVYYALNKSDWLKTNG